MSAFASFTREQWLTILTFVIVNFFNAMCASMQAPFYPREAAKKGLEVYAFGLVFGTFEMTVFLVSPFIGLGISRFGVKKTLNVGIGTVGLVLVAYGCLGFLQSGPLFLALSMGLRIIEACGNSAFLTGSFSAIARVFSDRVASMFSVIELFFGIGQIIGPVLGGLLYQIGGFTLPFAVMGSLLVFSAIAIHFIMPEVSQPPSDGDKPGMSAALKKPGILVALFKVSTAACSVGFIQTTLEPHLTTLNPPLTSLQIGAFFMVLGGSYGLSLPLWGYLCDLKVLRHSSKIVMGAGAALIILGFLIMGPCKWLPIEKSVTSIICGMILHGCGLGASLVGGFSDAHKSAIMGGLPDTIDTYGIVSGLWTSVFALGAFVGPVAGGFLYDAITFRWAIFMVVIAELVSLASIVAYIVSSFFWKSTSASYESLDSTSHQEEEVAGNRHKNYGSTASNDSANGATEKKSLGSESSSGGKRESFSDSFGASYAAARSMGHGSGSLGSSVAGLSQLTSKTNGRKGSSEREALIP